jgi:hypothetical protein
VLRLFAPGAGAPTAPFDALDSTPEKFPGGIEVDATFAASVGLYKLDSVDP